MINTLTSSTPRKVAIIICMTLFLQQSIIIRTSGFQSFFQNRGTQPSTKLFPSTLKVNFIYEQRRLQHSRIILASNYDDNSSNSDNYDVAQLRSEIEEMKREAIAKLNILEMATTVTTSTLSSSTDTPSTTINTSTPSKNDTLEIAINNDEKEDIMNGLIKRSLDDSDQITMNGESNIDENSFEEKVAISNKINSSDGEQQTLKMPQNEVSLLCNSNWKLSLSIGREPNTWMPKDWGVSGERLILNLEMTFTNEQLYEREEFLGSMGGANILKVNNNELTLAPSITAGERKIKVLNGGWRVAQGMGPMGTDMLRFYFEIQEQITRDGSDIYCPAGRIYCNCGYFPTNRQSSGFKERLKKQLDGMIQRAEQLDEEIAAEGPLSLTRFKKSAELFRLKVDMQSTGERLMAASIAEPSNSILKMSQDGLVGLTREGGVVCKVNKGVTMEYHILGRISLAPIRQ